MCPVSGCKGQLRFLRSESLIEERAHCVQIDECHLFFFRNLANRFRVIAVGVSDPAVIKGTTLHWRNENWCAAALAGFFCKLLQVGFVCRERSDAFRFLLFIVVSKLDEEIVARLHQAQYFVQTPGAQRAFQRLSRLCVVCNGDTRPEEACQHLSPAVIGFAWLIANGRIPQEINSRDIVDLFDLDATYSWAPVIEFQG